MSDESEIKRLTAERDAWRELAEARNALLAVYRAQTYPSEKLMRRLHAAKAAVRMIGDSDE